MSNSAPDRNNPQTESANADTSSASNPAPNQKSPNPLLNQKNLLIYFGVGVVVLLVLAVVIWGNLGKISKVAKTEDNQTKTEVPTLTASAVPGLKTAEGKIVKLDREVAGFLIESTTAGISQKWLVGTSGTFLSKYDDWQKLEEAQAKGSKEPVKLSGLVYEDYKVGDSVKLIARPDQDLATMTELGGIYYLLLR